ncbi:MAG: hypothetical protein WCK16_03835 [Candidatus Moraniibacteriota bacterium]
MPEQEYRFKQLEKKDKDFEVSYQNSEIDLPFKIEKMVFFKDPQGEFNLETHQNHHRASWFSPVGIKDKNNNIFFRIAMKGVGYLYSKYYASKKDAYQGKDDEITLHKSKEYGWGYNVLGLFDKRNVTPLIESANELTKAGLRCEAIAGAVNLEQVMLGGKKVDKKQLRVYLKEEGAKAGLSQKQLEDIDLFEPAEIIRLTRETMRIKDFCEENKKGKEEMLQNVFRTLNLENELKQDEKRYTTSEPESIKTYLQDTFKQAAINLAILHNGGKIMCYLNSGNMTLSLAEIVDLDSIISLNGKKLFLSPLIINDPEWKIPKGIIKDTRDEIYALGKMFLGGMCDLLSITKEDRQEFYRIFVENYKSKLDVSAFRKNQIDSVLTISMVDEFAQKMILDNQTVSPIKV